jgi:tetratricopeptide (TPR) repeat protein
MAAVDDDTTRADGEPEPGPTEAELEERNRLRRNIAVTLSALVVLGAGLAILQVDASANESNTARETTRTAVEAMRANVVADTVAGLEPLLQSERDFLAFRRPLDAGEPSLASAAGLPGTGAQVTGSLRVARSAVPDLGFGTLLPRLQLEAERLTLKQRALATTRVTWNDRSTQYTTVIAVLAVALFLVGFGLVVRGLIRPATYTLGVGVGVFVAVWAVWIHHLPIPSTPDTAITAAARGAVLTADGSYREAVASYDKALAAKDDYGAAYAGRARARLLALNPDFATTRAVTGAGGPAFEGAVSDARRALELNDRDILAAAIVAITSFYQGDYERAVTAAGEAAAINPKVPDVWLLKSAAQTAAGNPAAAKASLERAVSLLRGTGPSETTRLLASAYLSYLAWVERHVPAEAATARELTDRVVATETAFTLDRTLPKAPPARGRATVERLRFENGRLRLRLRWTGLPAGTTLSAIGYERPLAGGAWTQPAGLALFATVSGSGRRDISVPLQRACEPTAVRVDLYLNGARTVTRTGPGVAPTC